MPWTCRRCHARHENNRLRRCECGRLRPKRRRPAHLAALKLERHIYLAANDGYDGCWVCRYLGEASRKPLHRDHEHKGDGRPRGILCAYHNRLLGPRYTPELAAAFAAYLNRPSVRKAA